MLTISKKDKIYKMSKNNPPVAKVPSGSVVIFETSDAFNDQITSEEQGIATLDWNHVNPATGPLYIEGAMPGDVLKIEIQEINVADYGVTAAIPGAGIFGDQVKNPQVKILDVKDGYVKFNDKIRVPIKPMIGVIGVAPEACDIPCGTPDVHGGNMDNKLITAKTTLYLPVFHPGALLAMGDLHAAMGDGEVMVTGLEIAGQVKVKVDVIKGKTIKHPRLETATHFYTIASHADLLEATKLATTEMLNIVMEKCELSFNEAGMLLSMAGDTQIAQVVDPLLTARFAMSKDILPVMF